MLGEFYMETPRVHAAARSAAVLGSRNARRQLKSVLTAASEAGAYSVGFSVARGGLTGFSVYFAGDFAGASRDIMGAAAFTRAVPRSSTTTNAQALPAERAPAASAAPAPPAAARRRGCRAGAKQQLRRQGARGRSEPTAQIARPAAPLEGGAKAALPPGLHNTTHEPATPPVPPLHKTDPSLSAQPSSALSPLAPAFSPPPPPPPPSSSPSLQGEEDPLQFEASLRHLLPHARLSFEEQRWDHYSKYGGPFPPHGSSKKRTEPPSPAWGSPPSAIVGCVVNERRARAAPPPPPTPRLPPSRGR